MMSRLRQLLVALLIWQQLVWAVPAMASNTQAGKPIDAGALRASRLPLGSSSSPASADPFTGDATFEVPILAPPGTGGLTPQVSLAYSSGSPNGPLGIGWRVDIGPARIARSTRDGAPDFDATDEFELGGQRLIATGETDRYVLENHDFTRIEKVGDYWRVLSPDGQRRYYGYHYEANGQVPNLSRLDSEAVTSEACSVVACNRPASYPFDYYCDPEQTVVATGTPFAWYLDRIEDRNGNVIRLAWDSLGDPGGRYLTEISYSEHVGGSLEAVPDFGGADDGTITVTRSIRFHYEATRPDVIPGYRRGFRSEFGHRLDEVVVQVGADRVRRYDLAYVESAASGRSLLDSVSEHGTTDDAVSALTHTFDYTEGGAAGWEATPDAAWSLPAGLEYTESNRDAGIRLVDVNNDGYPDVVRGDGRPGGGRATYLGSATGFSSNPDPGFAPPGDFIDSIGYTGLVYGDLDGDGRLDMLRRTLDDEGQISANPQAPGCTASESFEVESGTLDAVAWLNQGTGVDTWVDAPEHQWGATFVEPEMIDPEGTWISSHGHCPTESFPTAQRFLNPSSPQSPVASDVSGRLVDVNGDGKDDFIYRRWVAAADATPDETGYFFVSQRSTGVVLNSEVGLAGGLRNVELNSCLERLITLGSITLRSGYADFQYRFPEPRWQVPLGIRGWSEVAFCVDVDEPVVGRSYSGAEALVDVNVDGLPDVLQSAQKLGQFFSIASLNNGYGWEFGAPPETSPYASDVPFTEGLLQDEFDFDGDTCSQIQAGILEDKGWRFIDVNGDGGPDQIGGPDGEVRLWDARLPDGRVWRAPETGPGAWALPDGVTFAVGDSQETAVRLADVNADGFVDILTSAGAYLNRASVPDRLAAVTGPWGAVTSLAYEPHTNFETPPPENPTVDGQRRASATRWVLSEITVDPGSVFGEPTITRELAYFDPVYDIEDRQFRGFGHVRLLSPLVANERARTDLYFHTSDALRGQVAKMVLSGEVGGVPTELVRVAHDYAASSGADPDPTVWYADGSTGTLAEIGEDSQTGPAFSSFTALMSGSPTAARAQVSYRMRSTVEEFEGEPTPLSSQGQWSYDAYGNTTRRQERGDIADGVDDIVTTLDFLIEDRAEGAGDWLYLANRPWRIIRNGQLGDLPAGTVLGRTTEVFYDGADGDPAVQSPARGNPTGVRRAWTDPEGNPTHAQVDRSFDVYGNLGEFTSAYDVAGAGAESFTRINYDSASHTFPTSILEGAFDHPLYDLPIALDYEQPSGCGAPKGLGLWCTATDPNGNVTTREYDTMGRVIATTAPNGFATARLYHDADRGTSNQRFELRVRWDPEAVSDPAGDPDAIRQVTYFDGLHRTLEETRRGRDSRVSRRLRFYDAAGRLASVSRWDFGMDAVHETEFFYDALGRLEQELLPDGTSLDRSYGRRETVLTTTIPGDGLVHKRARRVDGHGRLAAVDEYADPSGSPVTTTYAFDPFGQLAAIADAVANDGALCDGNPACAGQTHVLEVLYDELGNRVELRDPNAGTTTFEPDARGLPREITDARGKTQSLTYDPLGRLERRSTTNPDALLEADDVYTWGLSNTSFANGVGRLVRAEDYEGEDSFEYDAAGNVTFHRRTVLGLRFDFTRTYDPLGRVLTTLYPDGETATWHYDKQLLTEITSTNGAYAGDYVADVAYDALERETTLELGGSAGNPIVTRDAVYEGVSGWLDQVQAVAGGQTIADGDFTIDGAGRVRALDISTQGPGGGPLDPWNLTFEYDGLDRLTTANGATYDYDALGNMVQKDFSDPLGFQTMRYEDATRPHALTEAVSADGTRSVSYLYDAAGNVTLKSRVGDHGAPGQGVESVHFAYDGQGRIRRTRSSTGLTTIHRYGALGQRLGTSQHGEFADANGDLATGVADFTILGNQFGNDLLQGEPGDADFNGDLGVGIPDYTILGNDFGQTAPANHVLTPEPGYEYHPGLNRVNKHFFVGGLRVASSARSWTAPSAALPPILTGRPLSAPPLAVPLALGAAAALALLGLALRRRDPRLLPAPVPMRLGAVGTLLLVSPALLASPCGVGPPAVTTALGTHDEPVLFYVTDPLGSTVLTVDDAGSVRNRYYQMPFGDPGTAQEGPPLRHRFIGGEVLQETGLYALGARLYDPETGRFLQPDPIIADVTDPQAINAYSYGLNNPLTYSDPSGLAPEGGRRSLIVSVGLGTYRGEGGGFDILAHVSRLVARFAANFARWTQASNPRPNPAPGGPGASVGSSPISAQNEGGSGEGSQEGGGVDWRYWGNVGLEVVGWGLTVFDVVNTVVSPTPDTGILGASMIAGARTARAARAASRADDLFLRSTRAGLRLHGEIPHKGLLRKLPTERLSELRDMTQRSLRTRSREIRQLGDKGNHGRRIGEERRLLKNIEDILGNRGALE